MTNLITIDDLNVTDGGGEPRIFDLKLAKALGFVRRNRIRQLIESHMDALKELGVVLHHTVRNSRPQGGRPSEGYLLNKKQALYITAKSDTEKSALITIQMVDVFDQWLQNRHAGQPLISSECMIVSKAEWDRLVQSHAHVMQVAQDLDNQAAAMRRTVMRVMDAPETQAGPRFARSGGVHSQTMGIRRASRDDGALLGRFVADNLSLTGRADDVIYPADLYDRFLRARPKGIALVLSRKTFMTRVNRAIDDGVIGLRQKKLADGTRVYCGAVFRV